VEDEEGKSEGEEEAKVGTDDVCIPLAVRWDNCDNETYIEVCVGRIELIPAVQYAPEQQLFVLQNGEWQRASVLPSVTMVSAGHSQHCLRLEDGGHVNIDLNNTNHAPALFADLTSFERARQPYNIALNEHHAFIYDLFSDRQLDVRTETATLQCQCLARDNRAGKPVEDMVGIVHMTLRHQHNHRSSSECSVGYLARMQLLLLGGAASGKTTLLKTLTMEMLSSYPEHVPILIPVIKVVRVLNTCESGESIVVAYLRDSHPQQVHVLLQAMAMRRAVFLIDGIDESGANRKEVEHFVNTELLEPGHNTIITSRYSGVSTDAFPQCQQLELLPLTPTQQHKLARSRITDCARADELAQELQTDALKDIARNPLMLTMIISAFVKKQHTLVGTSLSEKRAQLYKQALETVVGRVDKRRAGVDKAKQEQLFQFLQSLAFHSHQRTDERRIFTPLQASKWATSGGWKAIEEEVLAERLPIIVSDGKNSKNEREYQFGHLSYQEFLAAGAVHARLASDEGGTEGVLTEVFGKPASQAFTDVRHHLLLQLLAGLLNDDQRTNCSLAMLGSDALKFDGYLGRAGAEALSPYVKANTTLRLLDMSGTKLGKCGMCVLAEALANTNVAHLDISQNEIRVEGSGDDKLDGVAGLCQLVETSR
jgi:hypothetical protein